jgi:hypothetical protein
MKNLVSTLCKAFLLVSILTGIFLGAVSAQAQTDSRSALTYSVAPDLRKCPSPFCGGWFLTQLNQYSVSPQSEDEAYQSSLILPRSIYVANINYKRLGLTERQIAEFETYAYASQALLSGNIVTNLPMATNGLSTSPSLTVAPPAPSTLIASGAWTAANKTQALGPYLKVTSSGIVCITTPCSYFVANIINSMTNINFDELSLAKAELTREQEAQAWRAVASKGLVMTGVKYASQGQVGTGLGISATKVFFAFPQ